MNVCVCSVFTCSRACGFRYLYGEQKLTWMVIVDSFYLTYWGRVSILNHVGIYLAHLVRQLAPNSPNLCLPHNMIKDEFPNSPSFFLIRYFLHLHFQCYPKVPHTLPPQLPCPPTHTSWPWHSPCIEAYKVCKTNPRTRPSSDTYAARDTSSGGYWLVHIAVPPIGLQIPPSSLGTFSSSSIGGPVIHSIADCEHPLLFARPRHSLTRDSYIWVLSAKSC
jgi:hypothetical protein